MWDAIENYLKYLKEVKNCAETTCNGYSEDLRRFYRFLNPTEEKKICLADVDKNKILEYLKSVTNVEKVSASYRNRRLSVIRSFFQYCIKERLANSDPTEEIEQVKIQIQEPDFLTYDDYERIITHIEKKSISDFYKFRDLAIVATLYHTGLRLQELIDLDIENIDFQTKEFRNILRKGGRRVNLPVNNEALKNIKIWLEFRKKEDIGGAEKALFLSHQKCRIHQSSIQFLIVKYSNECGFKKKITPHIFRHSFCTEIQNRGASISIAKELLNHYSITTTARYSHTTEEAKRRAVDSLIKGKNEDK